MAKLAAADIMAMTGRKAIRPPSIATQPVDFDAGATTPAKDPRPQTTHRRRYRRTSAHDLTTADISDSAGAQKILDQIRKRWPWVKHLFADGDG